MKLRSIRIAAVLLLVATACDAADGDTGAGADTSADPAPVEIQTGESLYNANCADCHGIDGVGTEQGPPHVHIVYEPNHHPDDSFRNAIELGVRAHHFQFGDMEPIEGLSENEVDEIIGYVRWLQRQAGIE